MIQTGLKMPSVRLKASSLLSSSIQLSHEDSFVGNDDSPVISRLIQRRDDVGSLLAYTGTLATAGSTFARLAYHCFPGFQEVLSKNPQVVMHDWISHGAAHFSSQPFMIPAGLATAALVTFLIARGGAETETQKESISFNHFGGQLVIFGMQLCLGGLSVDFSHWSGGME